MNVIVQGGKDTDTEPHQQEDTLIKLLFPLSENLCLCMAQQRPQTGHPGPLHESVLPNFPSHIWHPTAALHMALIEALKNFVTLLLVTFNFPTFFSLNSQSP